MCISIFVERFCRIYCYTWILRMYLKQNMTIMKSNQWKFRLVTSLCWTFKQLWTQVALMLKDIKCTKNTFVVLCSYLTYWKSLKTLVSSSTSSILWIFNHDPNRVRLLEEKILEDCPDPIRLCSIKQYVSCVFINKSIVLFCSVLFNSKKKYVVDSFCVDQFDSDLLFIYFRLNLFDETDGISRSQSSTLWKFAYFVAIAHIM